MSKASTPCTEPGKHTAEVSDANWEESCVKGKSWLLPKNLEIVRQKEGLRLILKLHVQCAVSEAASLYTCEAEATCPHGHPNSCSAGSAWAPRTDQAS